MERLLFMNELGVASFLLHKKEGSVICRTYVLYTHSISIGNVCIVQRNNVNVIHRFHDALIRGCPMVARSGGVFHGNDNEVGRVSVAGCVLNDENTNSC